MLLVFVCFLPLGFGAEQQQIVEPSYWSCYQVGTIKKRNAFIVSNIYYSNGSPNKHMKFFGKIIKKFEPKFEPAFEPSCMSDNNLKEMKKRWEVNIKKAKKRKFTIIQIKLSVDRQK